MTVDKPGPGTVALRVDELSIHFGGLVAVDRMTFEVREGEVLSLIGPNGAGKTTAFNAITGYLPPTSGEISYLGTRVNALKPNQVADLGVVRTFQKTSVFGGQTVMDNILIGLHRCSNQSPIAIILGLASVGREERQLREQAWEILKFVGLDARAGEAGASLPYGEQRLLEVAIALAAKPTLLLLDEPVSGMNPSETKEFMKLLGRIRERDITILLVEHDMRMVMGVSDRIVVLNQGRIIADGAPKAIRENPDVIRAYLGEKYVHAQS